MVKVIFGLRLVLRWCLSAPMRLPHKSWIVVCLLSAGALAHGGVVISNTPNGSTGGSTLDAQNWKALLFTTNASEARIESVTLGLNPLTPASVPIQLKVEMALYSVQAGLPSLQLTTSGLQAVQLNQTQQTYVLATGSGFNLAPNTQYALVVRSDATGIKWGNTASPGGTTPTAYSGYTFDGFRLTTDGGATWTSPASNVNTIVISVGELVSVPTLSKWTTLILMLFVLVCLASQREVVGRLRDSKHRSCDGH